jgi:histidinol phosphatase-like enzyme (inositol monophosphatase family)
MEAAAEVARVAGAAALRHYRTGVAVDRKADGSPVTAADLEAEAAARQWIAGRFPDDGILGEELGWTRPDARRRWLVDPIDGTKSFIRGVPLWGSLVAVLEGERVLAGAASFPALDEEIAAALGQGCWWNGAACRVSEVASLSEATALVTDERVREPRHREAWLRLAESAALSRTWGDCYGYLLVATGRAEVMVDPALSPWDAAAVMAIVEAAGGVFTDWSGAPTAFGGDAIATNAALAEEARRLLSGADTLARGKHA